MLIIFFTIFSFYYADKVVKLSNYNDTILASINIMNYFDNSLLSNTKKILDKGIIIFIKENKSNLNELLPTIKYIKSRGYNIVSIDELLS